MARFNILMGPNPGLLYEAAARREENFKIYFTLAMQIVELSEPFFNSVRPFRLYACVDDPRYDYIDYRRTITLRPVLSAQDPIEHLLKMNGDFSLLNQKGQLETESRYDHCLPIDWLGLSGRVINPLKRRQLSLVEDVISRFTDRELCQLYIDDSLRGSKVDYEMNDSIVADAVRCVLAFRARMDGLELALSGWRHSESQLSTMF